jgi:hypothetical protein
MSTLVAQTISNGTVSTSTANVINGAKAWVNFNGTTTPPTIRAQYNVSSITKNANGNYTVNFTNAFVDANYSAFTTNIRREGVYSVGYAVFTSDSSTSSYRPATTRVTVFAAINDPSTDTPEVYVSIFR